MERTFQCPSCGAGNTVTNPGVLMKVCDFCKTAIYWDKESALRAGAKSVDLPESTRFRVGSTGKIKGQSFRVLGRLYYAHEKGTWDEWFIELDNGKILWMAEDEGEIFLEKKLELTEPVPPFDELKPGMQISLNDKIGVVEELGQAKCLGGEGEIPFPVEIGETYNYADGTGADGSFIFGLEYDDETGGATAFTGKALGVKDTKAGAGAGAPAAQQTGQIIRCASCGKPYEGKRLDTTEMVVCESCGSQLELDKAETKVVGQNQGRKPLFSLDIGQPITLWGIRYEIMGRLYYVEVDEGIHYPSYEYILYNPEQGYLWLSHEQGHFTISSPIHIRINCPAVVAPRQKTQVGDETFLAFEQGTVTLQWVDGALPWVAGVGETTRYTTLIKPPEYVDREITGSEMELFRGRYVDHDEMLAGLSKEREFSRPLPAKRGVYSCQPYKPSPWVRGLWAVGAVFLALNLFLLIASYAKDKNQVIMVDKVTAADYKKEYLSKPFRIDKKNEVLRLEGSAPLSNSWLSLDFGLVNASDQVVGEFYDEASFYHGKDSEGYWTEGSRKFKEYFKVEKPGTYRLLVHGKGGSGSSGQGRGEPVTISVARHVTISWYFLGPLILSFVVAILGVVYKMIFEQRRWASVMEDEDDDD